jgi:hypothetical protein
VQSATTAVADDDDALVDDRVRLSVSTSSTVAPTADAIASAHESARRRTREQIAATSLIARARGTHGALAALWCARALRADAGERAHMRRYLEPGDCVLEQLLGSACTLGAAHAPPGVPPLVVAHLLNAGVRALTTALQTRCAHAVAARLTAPVEGDDDSATSSVTLLRVPQVRVGLSGEWLDVSAAAVRAWEQLQLESYSARKDVVYHFLCPANAFMRAQCEAFMRELSACYQRCGLGAHSAALRDGIHTFAVPRAATRAQYAAAVGSACSALASALASTGAARINTCTLVYVVDAFVGAGGADADTRSPNSHSARTRVATPQSPSMSNAAAGGGGGGGNAASSACDTHWLRTLADATTPLAMRDTQHRVHNLLVSLVSLADMAQTATLAATLRDISFAVAAAARRVPVDGASASAGGDATHALRRLYEPVLVLPRHVVAPLVSERNTMAESELRALDDAWHCCYVIVSARVWACVSDAHGGMLESVSVACEPTRRASLSSVWRAVNGLLERAVPARALVLCALGSTHDDADDADAADVDDRAIWEQVLLSNVASVGNVYLVALTHEWRALVHIESAHAAVCAARDCVVWPVASARTLPAVALLVNSGVCAGTASEPSNSSSSWPVVWRVELCARWTGARAADASPAPHASWRPLLARIAQQFASLSWLNVTAHCPARASTLPFHAAHLLRLVALSAD